MSTIVCGRPCKYKSGEFCKRQILILNQFGLCNVWFDKNGQIRQVPNYPAEPEPKVTNEQQPPHQE